MDDLKLFVYGTLRRGECRHRLLYGFGVRNIAKARTRGKLVHLGEYPGMVHGKGWVWGELITLDRLDDAIPFLDRVEDYRPEEPDRSLYVRELIPVQSGMTETGAWAYLLQRPPANPVWIPSGDWRRVSYRLRSRPATNATTPSAATDRVPGSGT
jgi:gamma-glutamylcyclotransferase (GGCT)/AIG2-like uncharacterized protein YtfP